MTNILPNILCSMASRSLRTHVKYCKYIYGRSYCSNAGLVRNSVVSAKRDELFSKEKARQTSLIPRIEKIKVDYKGLDGDDCSLLMNKELSTPYNCAMHLSELLMERSVLAMVNGQPWDMHRPLDEDCTLEFKHFKDEDPNLVNEALWRSGSFILGYVLESAFKDSYYVELCSFPRPNVKTGSFVYDADLKLTDWEPSETELRTMSRIGAKLGHEMFKFERLEVDASIAHQMFSDNRFKVEQIPSIASQSPTGNTVTLYRMGTHVDMSRGPLMSGTHLLNRFSITAIHDIESPDFGPLKRVQGIAIPKQLSIHYYSFELLAERAAKINRAQIPRLYSQASLQAESSTG